MTQLCRTLNALALVFCVMFLSGGVFVAHAQQEANLSYQFTFEELGFREDRVASGTVVTLFYEMPVPHSWRGVVPTFNLHFSHSALLLPHLSQMTVLYNDVPVTDVRLTADNAESSWLQITIPEHALKENRHQLKISLYQRLTDERCGDSGTEAGLWTVLHKDSVVTFDVTEKAALDLSWFPEPFSIYDRLAIAPASITIMLPAQPRASDLRAAGLVSAKLGQLIGMRMLDLSLSLGKLPATGHVVVIGQPQELAPLLKGQPQLPIPLTASGFTGAVGVQPDEGVIEISSRSDGSGLLLISGMGELGVLRAAEALADGDSLHLMAGEYTIVKDSPRSLLEPKEPQQFSTLQELTSTGNQRVEGVNVKEVNYCFRLPLNWEMQAGTQLDLHYGFSPNLWYERSSLAVRFNSTLVASVKLNAETGGSNELQIPLPQDHFVDGYNCLSFLYTLRLEQSECVAEMGGEIWGEIDAQSSILYLPHSEKKEEGWQPDLGQYPYPFNVDYNLANTSLILPDTPTEAEIVSALQLAARLGSEVRHPGLQITLKTAAAWVGETDQLHNLILIGSATRNSVAATLQNRSVALSEENDLTVQIREEIFARQQSGAKLAVAEMGLSPWTSDRVVLQLISNGDKSLLNLAEVLSRNRNEESLDGNILTVTEDNLVRNVDTLDRSTKLEEVKVTAQGVITTEPETISTIRWFLIGGAVVLGGVGTLLVILTIRERLQRKRRNME